MRRRVVAAALLAVGMWALGQWPAAASPAGIEVDVAGTGFTASPSANLIDVSRLVPGASASGVLGVRNTTSNPVSVTLQFVDVHASENGCTHPERAAADGCHASGPGQLRDALRFTISLGSGRSGPYSATWTGTVAALQRGVGLGGELPADGTQWVRLTAGLPGSTGNEVQSDTFGFDLRVALSGAGAATASSGFGVAGVSTVHGMSLGSGASASGGLSFTGIPTLFMVGAGMLFIVCGALIAMVFRDRRGGPVGEGQNLG